MHFARIQAHPSKLSLCVTVQDPVAEKTQLLPHLCDMTLESPPCLLESPCVHHLYFLPL